MKISFFQMPTLRGVFAEPRLNKYIRRLFPIMLSLSACCFINTAQAQPEPTVINAVTINHDVLPASTFYLKSVRQQYQLVQERNDANAEALSQLKKDKANSLNQMTAVTIDPQQLSRADLEVALASTVVDGANLAQAEAQQTADNISTQMRNLEDQLQTVTLSAGKAVAVKQKLAAMQNELHIQKETLKWQNRLVQVLSTSNDLANQRLSTLQTWRDQLKNIYQIQQKQLKDTRLAMQEHALQLQQKALTHNIVNLNAQMLKLNPNDPKNLSQRSNLDLQMLNIQEQSNLLRLKSVLLRLQAGANTQLEPLPMDPSVQMLKNKLTQGNTLLTELENLKSLVNQKMALLEKRANFEMHAKTIESSQQYTLNFQVLRQLLKSYDSGLNEIIILQNKIMKEQSNTQAILTKALARRQGLPGLNLIAWQDLGQQIATIPSLASKAATALKDQVVIAASKLDAWSVFILLVAELFWLWIWLGIRYSVRSVLSHYVDSDCNAIDKSRYVLLRLLEKNLITLCVLVAITIAFALLGLSLRAFEPIIYLLWVWVVFKLGLGLAQILLIEPHVKGDPSRDHKLYRELYWALMGGGLLTMLTVLTHQLPVGYEVGDFFNRLFMVFLLVTALVLLRHWRVLPSMLKPYTSNRRPYLRRVIKLLAVFIPLVILSTAIIGLLGYVDLAWTLSVHEGLFLLVMTGYILVRGLLKDMVDGLSEFFIAHLQHGWLWTQAFLKPGDKLIRFLLLLGAAATLFWLYGWDEDSLVVEQLINISRMHLINTKGLSLTVMDLVSLIVAGMLVRWVSKWSREFAFRWIYNKQRDLGTRTSLATLTQYLVFMISIFLALKIVGVDLSGVAYVLAGFAAGVGLGLRDLIKNYASGLLLLFERPIRTGDTVTIGDFEGEVTHIGMRAITLKTSDHMQVLVPNAETFEKPFTNWTYVDTIIRTVITLKVVREDDPAFVRAIILDVLHKLTAVVTDPAPQVFLMNMDDALLEFEVRYFINLEYGRSRTDIRSEVLFAIFEAFKLQGIHTPHESKAIYVEQFPVVNLST